MDDLKSSLRSTLINTAKAPDETLRQWRGVFVLGGEEVKMLKPKPKLRVVFKSNSYLRCVFHSLVVKMSALEKKFEGGPGGYLNEYKATCNRDLAVVNAMGTRDLWPIVEDLDNSGFIPREDTFMFHATSLGLLRQNGQKVNPGIEWLTGHADGIAVLIRLK